MKSILENLKVLKLLFLPFWGSVDKVNSGLQKGVLEPYTKPDGTQSLFVIAIGYVGNMYIIVKLRHSIGRLYSNQI